MNERLEKEIDSYIATHFSEAYDGVLLSDATSTELAITDVAPMARYFYSLALQDVREILERYDSECAYSPLSEDADYYVGKNDACKDILSHVDNLTK